MKDAITQVAIDHYHRTLQESEAGIAAISRARHACVMLGLNHTGMAGVQIQLEAKRRTARQALAELERMEDEKEPKAG